MMSEENQKEEFSRLRLLVGEDGVALLRRARVLLVGVGGVGSWAAEALVRGGVGHLTMIDYDLVRPSNINRQLHALHSTVGQEKVLAMSARLRDIAPDTELCVRNERLAAASAAQCVADGPWDVVIDAIDERPAKLALLAACVQAGIPIISSMGAANKLRAGDICVADIADSYGCPLAKVIRKQLKKIGISNGIRVVFSPEGPVRLENGEFIGSDRELVSERRPLGSISYMPALFGLRCAAEAIESILRPLPFSRRGES
ncbi:MAG: tRNA threonylcarbamoyladenosine dehydratase [Lentisphaerae bacterium]|jgi:tRNA A37 threonylcarbamoyladenosine dehydratase|nr:tRNA threonylcarbamoyladenosine dehydratase [Lentisphaerota bacterium]